MMKRGEIDEEEALYLSHSPLQNSWNHHHNLLPGDSSSSSSRFSLRSPSDYLLSSYFSNGHCNGSSPFTSHPFDKMTKTKYDHDLSLCESLLHRLNISEEEQEKSHHQNFTGNQLSYKSVHHQGTFNNHSVQSYSPRRSFVGRFSDHHPSLLDLQGYIYLMAKDQHGCRSLQKILEDGTSLDTMVIFNEVFPHVVEFMINPFGNYLMQKLLDVCNEEQRTMIILAVTSEPGLLVRIALNPHGTRVVQRLVESIKTKKQVFLVTSALRTGFLNLAMDVNGNHVIQRCLQCLTTQDNEFIFEDATRFCIDIATHQHGCCVLQKCVAYSTGQQRENLITKICRNCLFLAQDRYGNYAVQFVIEMRDFQATAMVLARLKGHYVELSMRKFSSHMVERCLKQCPESRPQIVLELISVPRFDLLIQDPFANFVIQAALSVTKGSLHDILVEVIRPHSNLRKNPYCKKIFSRNLLRN
ncbi:putative pumilio 8 [Hirschfeldia incana]|nr:putative pumilio 8 [Hirschfeldia incana]